MYSRLKHQLGWAPDHLASDPARLAKAVEAYKELENVVAEIKIEGTVTVASSDDAYEKERRRCFYLHDAGYPMAFMKVKTIQDVSEIVTKVQNKAKLAILCGGHTPFSIADNSIVIDLTGLNDVKVDTENRLATIGGGCKIEMVDKALENTGLGFVTGTNGDTGVSGLTLAGGFGFLSSNHGFACDNVVKATVVLADGKIVEASDDSKEYSDLMKALRGGGGNFGVVVEWTMKLHDVKDCFGGLSVRICPTHKASVNSLKSFVKEMKTLPTHTATGAVLPSGGPVNVYLGVTYEEGAAKAKSWKDLEGLQFVKNLGGWFEAQNNIKKRDHASDMQKLLEPMNQPSFTFTSALAMEDISDELADALVSLRASAPTKQCVFIIFKMHGKGRDPALAEKSVLGHREKNYWIIYEGGYTQYSAHKTVEKVQAWMAKVKKTILSHSGCDLPYPMFDANHKTSSAEEHKAYVGANKAYMAAMKAKYDPSNVFSLNKNVTPEADSGTAMTK